MEKPKYEREIEEILEKYEKTKATKGPTQTEDRQVGGIRPSGFAPPSPQRMRTPQRPSTSFNWRRLTAGQLIGAAIAVAILAVLVHNVSGLLSNVLVIAAVVLFLLPIFTYRSTGTTSGGWSSGEEKRWRGQPIDINTRRPVGDDPLAGIRRWFRKR
jgi:hypothetical protein